MENAIGYPTPSHVTLEAWQRVRRSCAVMGFIWLFDYKSIFIKKEAISTEPGFILPRAIKDLYEKLALSKKATSEDLYNR